MRGWFGGIGVDGNVNGCMVCELYRYWRIIDI